MCSSDLGRIAGPQCFGADGATNLLDDFRGQGPSDNAPNVVGLEYLRMLDLHLKR